MVIFEGRDSAGKGGVIKRITQRLNPRVARVVALPAPTTAKRPNGTFSATCRTCRPAVNRTFRPLLVQPFRRRAGYGLCHRDEVDQFFHDVPEFERMLVRSGIRLIKYWFSITDEEQQLRFLMRIHDPLKQWKLSPMDLDSRGAGRIIPRPRRRPSPGPTSPRRPGISSRATTRSADASTASTIS